MIAIASIQAFSQMTDAKFIGLNGKVRAVWTERTFTIGEGQRLNKPELIKSLYYDKKGFLTRSSTFEGGESRRVHSTVGSQRQVNRFEFDAAGNPLSMVSVCQTSILRNTSKKSTDPNLDYFYSYLRDSRKRISGVNEYCDSQTVLTKSTFMYNSKDDVVADVRCQPQYNTCDSNYYKYDAKGREIEQKVTSTAKGVETCVSVTRYSDYLFDKHKNEIRRIGTTTDCTNDKVVFFKFIDSTRIEYY